MSAAARIERALELALKSAERSDSPPRLAEAMHYAVFPGGARVRPKLTLAVAGALGADNPALLDAALAAIEFMHCASLVHDDLPCFDDAATRRGKASVHTAFDERLGILTGDALLVLAFDTLARGGLRLPGRLGPSVAALARGIGAPAGIIAGQAWECEADIPLQRYQRQKTGALFVAATELGATAAGADPAPWSMLGQRMGEAYQVADDILDLTADAEEIGKPVGRDAALKRPNAALEYGMSAAEAHLKAFVAEAIAAIPPCPGEHRLRELIAHEAQAFMDYALLKAAAA